MLGQRARQYHNSGYNCSQCILMAFGDIYKVSISEQSLKMCSTVNNGFGVCGMCSVLVASIMAIGIMFEEDMAKRMRIKFLAEFSKKHKSMNCNVLKTQDCGELIVEVGELLESVINCEL